MIINLQDIFALNVMEKFCEIKKEEGLKIGFTSGCFDLFHEYHRMYLERCKRACDILIVGVDSDFLVQKTKGTDRPKISEKHRISLIDDLIHVQFSFIMNSIKDWSQIVTLIEPSEIYKNDAFIDREAEIPGNDIAKIVIIKDVEEVSSTTDLIKSIRK